MSTERKTINQDEIDLVEIIRLLWKRRFFIIGCSLILLISTYIILYIKPINKSYQSLISIYPPIIFDLAEININLKNIENIKTLSVKDAYSLFGQILVSENLKNEFLRKFSKFSDVKIQVDLNPFITIKVLAPSIEKASEAVNQFVLYGHQTAMNDLNHSTQNMISAAKKKIKKLLEKEFYQMQMKNASQLTHNNVKTMEHMRLQKKYLLIDSIQIDSNNIKLGKIEKELISDRTIPLFRVYFFIAVLGFILGILSVILIEFKSLIHVE